jgi:hypothetical protein
LVRYRTLIVAALASIAATIVPGSARADDSAGADVLFQQGKSLNAEGKAAEACPKFEASYKLDKKLGTLLNWGDCLERTGKVASAHAHFAEAAEWAKRENDSRAEFAATRRDALTQRLPHLLLDVKLGREKLDVYENDALVDPSHYGLALAVDPGVVVVSVRRGEDELESRRVEAKEAAETDVALDLDAIAASHPPKTKTLAAGKRQRVAGFVVGGVGVAGLAAFGLLEGLAYNEKSDATSPGGCKFDDASKTYVCTPEGYRHEKKAGDLAEAGQWTGIVSGVVVAVGITLLATAPRARAVAAPSTAVVPWVSDDLTSFGLVLGGTL